jgi:hypothetical protein
MVLDGQEWLAACGPVQSYSDLVCTFPPAGGACMSPPAGATLDQYTTGGNLARNTTLTMGGPAGTIYDVTARFQGVVEPKHYQGGVQGTAAAGSTSTNFGWYVGGEPNYSGNYSVYMLWVSSPVVMPTQHLNMPPALAGQYYWLNAINQNEAHFSYRIDYTVTFSVAAGAMVRFLMDDSNCSIIKNCDTTSVEGSGGAGQCHTITVPNLPAAAANITQPYDGQFIYMQLLSIVAH